MRNYLDDWGKSQQKIKKLTEQKIEELLPFQKEFEEKTKGIQMRYERKLAQEENRSAELEKTITEWLKANNTPIVVEGELAIASNELQKGRRVIDVKAFMAIAADKGDAVYECLNVGIDKAEKLLGKIEVDRIATAESKIVQRIKLK